MLDVAAWAGWLFHHRGAGPGFDAGLDGNIRVRLAPFPALIREDGGALVVDMLEELIREDELR